MLVAVLVSGPFEDGFLFHMKIAKLLTFVAVTVFLLSALARHSRAQGTAQPLNPAELVQRAIAAQGNGWTSGQVKDSTCEGKLTLFGMNGPRISFDTTLSRKGKQQVQRIIKEPAGEIREGSDGNQSWHSVAGRFPAAARGPALRFIESQTVRSIQTFLNYQDEGLILRDLGSKGTARVVEAEDKSGRRTSYFLDNTSSIVTRLEFVTGQAQDPFSKRNIPTIESYQFSDFRIIQGLLTPFKIERFFNGIKTEETVCTSVRYNVSVDDKVFRP